MDAVDAILGIWHQHELYDVVKARMQDSKLNYFQPL